MQPQIDKNLKLLVDIPSIGPSCGRDKVAVRSHSQPTRRIPDPAQFAAGPPQRRPKAGLIEFYVRDSGIG
jgi:hypothetical protein